MKNGKKFVEDLPKSTTSSGGKFQFAELGWMSLETSLAVTVTLKNGQRKSLSYFTLFSSHVIRVFTLI